MHSCVNDCLKGSGYSAIQKHCLTKSQLNGRHEYPEKMCSQVWLNLRQGYVININFLTILNQYNMDKT